MVFFGEEKCVTTHNWVVGAVSPISRLEKGAQWKNRGDLLLFLLGLDGEVLD